MNRALTCPGFILEVDDDKELGWFEDLEKGDTNGGGLWFEAGELIDYDGVFALPPAVVAGLRIAGYDVGDINLLDEHDVRVARELEAKWRDGGS